MFHIGDGLWQLRNINAPDYRQTINEIIFIKTLRKTGNLCAIIKI